jgi:hypothetical protein
MWKELGLLAWKKGLESDAALKLPHGNAGLEKLPDASRRTLNKNTSTNTRACNSDFVLST